MRYQGLVRAAALKRTLLSIALASACASAWALPQFTLTPGAVGLTGAAVTADNIVLSDFLTATVTGTGSTFSERGYLSVASFQLGSANVVADGLNTTYSLYFDFSATGHLTSANIDPSAGMTTGVFDTLTYSLVGANGNASFSTAGNNPSVTNAGATQVLATGSLQNGVTVSIPVGGTFVPSAAATVSFAVAAGKEGFFSPEPFYNVASTAFVNAITSLSRFGTPGTPGSGFTVNNGGGNLNFQMAPIPEPETYALMLAGLGAIGWAARRRNARA